MDGILNKPPRFELRGNVIHLVSLDQWGSGVPP